MPCQLSRSNKGWHAQWFYVKNDAATPLLDFTGCLIEEAPLTWPWGPPVKEKKRMCDVLEAVASLRSRGLHGASVIGAYHPRRVASLMELSFALYGMMPVHVA